MAKAQIIDKPRRWDVPFSRDLPNPDERRDMTDEDVDHLIAMAPFKDMDPASFPKHLALRDILQNDTRIRHYRDGDVIVRQGDYGNSAFLILEGAVSVVLEGLNPERIGRSESHGKSWIRSIANLITKPSSPEVRDASQYPQLRSDEESITRDGTRILVQDVTNVPMDVINQTKNVPRQQGHLFGELAALGRMPRTATVIGAGSDGAGLLEIRWQGLRDLRKHDEALRESVDEQFRQFGLADALRASPLLSYLSEENAQEVAQRAEFETHGAFDWFGTFQQLRKKDEDPLSKEPKIAEEGHYPNGLILIRAGFARLSRKHGHGERTFSYLGKGEVYGLAELIHNAQNEQQIPLGATLRAVGYVDIVRIPTKVFEQLIQPHIPDHLLSDALQKTSDTVQLRTPAKSTSVTEPSSDPAEKTLAPATMEFLVQNRFINGTATMMIDLDRCTRCDDCVRACASGHDNNPRFIRHGTTFGHHMVANACMHCVDPVCMIGCPTGAIHRHEAHGEVVINDITCIGCGMCAASCPYDNIRMVEVRDSSNNDAIMVDPAQGGPITKATKCDLCVDHHGGPACQRACPHDALKRVDMRDLDSLSKWMNR